MTTTTLKVEGMMCRACAGHVTRALQSVAGTLSVVVDLAAGEATVQHGELDTARLVEAVVEDGYGARVLTG